MILFLAGLFGGLGIGCFIGFWGGARAQRQLGLIFKLEAAKAHARESDAPYDQKDWDYEPKGTEHPVGPVPPSPSQVTQMRQKRNPLKWWMEKRQRAS